MNDRDLAVAVLKGAAQIAETLGKSFGHAGVGTGVSVLISIVASLVEVVGVEDTQEAVAALVARKDEGTITAADLTADGSKVMAGVAEWYRNEAGEHPEDE